MKLVHINVQPSAVH